jgi:hypothetical protein
VHEDDHSVATGEASPLPATEPFASLPPLPPAPARRKPAAPAARPAPARTRVTTLVPQPDPSARRTPAKLAALAALVVAAGVLAAVLLSSGGSDPGPAASTKGQRAAARPRTHAARSTSTQAAATGSGSAVAPAGGEADTTTTPAGGAASGETASGYVAYARQGYRLERPAGWVTEKDASPENDLPRYRSQWTNAGCGCELIVDYIPGYGETALQNAAEVPGGTVTAATVGGFDNVARRTALAGSRHEATYFIAVGPDNYAVKASAPSEAQAEAIASHVAASLSPAGA